MSEAAIERFLVEQVKGKGGYAFKWVSPGTAGVMDRLVLLPVLDAGHAEIVNRYVKLVELKDTGKKASPLQVRLANRLGDLGYRVWVIDSKDLVREVLR